MLRRIFAAWRDGYAEGIAQVTGMPETEVRACFDEMLAAIDDPLGYAVWHVPIVGARVPAARGGRR